ncbi:MAG: hypothetical protein LBU87_03890 [Lactobacillales bacterium]|jgi:type IV secretory pathway component VirB8|nr:hypothetical protein [Lactobacillales bacterium]
MAAPLRENTSKKKAKFWIMLTAFLIALNVFFSITLLQMASKLQVVAQILTSPMSSNQLIVTEPFSVDVGDKKLIDEMIVRYYLSIRHNFFPDDTEIQRRWSVYGPIFVFSTPEVYRDFRKSIEPRLEGINKANYTQNIDVRSVTRNGNIFSVDFDIYTLTNMTVSVTHRVAIIEIFYDPNNVFYISEYANPYGLTVKQYRETEKR